MRKKNEYLTTAQKVKLEKRRKFAADFLKVYPPCFVVTGLVTLFAIFMTGDFYDAFTPERGAATAGVFVIHEVLAGFLIASTHASAEDARFPMREVLLSFLMTIITYIVCLATAKFLNVFALPVCLAALVLTVLSNRRTSSITSLVIVAMLLVSFIRGENYPDAMLPEVILSVVGNFAAALAVNMLVDKHLARLPFILVSFAASALGMLVVFAGTLVMGDIGINLLFNVLWSYGASVGAVLVFTPIVAILEGVFNIADDFRLNELTNLNQPLLKRLASEAPGTFNHSLVVGNLSEACAGAIGENPHMARAAAYYHDIGKLKAPVYFSENQTGYNPHDELIPEVSVSMITSHTVFGEILAKQYRLPPEIVAVCREHHVGEQLYLSGTQAADQDRRHSHDRGHGGSGVQSVYARHAGGLCGESEQAGGRKAAARSVRRVSHHHEGPLRHQDHHHRDFAAGAARQSFLREEEGMIEFTGARFAERRLIRKVEKAVYAELGQTDIFEVDLAVTDGETVREFNRETRGVDSETDVLSFPYFEGLKLPVTEEDFSDEAFDGRRVALGSIMISSPRAHLQAEEYGHSYERELGFLACHGLLHLLGFDHIDPDDEKRMRAVADRVMERVGLPR